MLKKSSCFYPDSRWRYQNRRCNDYLCNDLQRKIGKNVPKKAAQRGEHAPGRLSGRTVRPLL